MSLTSASTLAQIEAEYDDCADYDLVGSVERCKLFIHAARLLLRRRKDEIETGGNRVQEDRQRIERQLERAENWLGAQTIASTSPRVTSGFTRGLCR